MKETGTYSWPGTVSLLMVLLICLTIVPHVEGQTGMTSVVDLQYPSQAVLQNGVAEVSVTFKMYFTYYVNPQGYLVFGIYYSGTSNPVEGSATSWPDPCQSLAGTPNANDTVCAIVPPTSAGSESASVTLTLDKPQQYALSVVTFVWDSRNLQSGNRAVDSVSTTDFTITVTGEAISTTPITSNTTIPQISSTATTTTSTPTSTTLSSMTSTSTQTSLLVVSGSSGIMGTLSPTTLLLVGVAAALAVLLVVMLRRPKPIGPATSQGVRADVIYCEHCGTQSSTASQFCEKCGTKLQP